MTGPAAPADGEPIRFDAWVERCLYHPEHGFYASGAGSAGRRRGDFITSPEVGPLFADVLARALDLWWDELGRPDVLPVYDVGTGPGTLARALAAGPGPSVGARRVTGLDLAGPVVTPPGPDPTGDGPGLPPDLTGAVVIANELLDNLPFRVVEHRPDGWYERFVTVDPATGAADAVMLPCADDPGLDGPEGVPLPWLERARAWVAGVLARGPAVLLVLDYGAATTAELGRRGGWLRTYRQHERGDDPLAEPGRWDITTDLAVDQLPGRPEVESQAAFLRRHGIDELVDEGRSYWADHAARPDLRALRMRSRIREAEALLDPSGLGSWLTCLWR